MVAMYRKRIGILVPLIGIVCLCTFNMILMGHQSHSQDQHTDLFHQSLNINNKNNNHHQNHRRPQSRNNVSKIDLYPFESPIPNPPFSDGYTTMSACLLVMDDNHRLAEWMAYHYHVLPLRTMIVATDPRSETSPGFLLNRWRRQGMHIVEWNDTDFWKPLQDLPPNATFQNRRDRHRGRQKFFYRKCLIQLRQWNRTWVSLHDTDEYMVYNHAGGSQEALDRWEDMMESKHMLYKGKSVTRIKPSRVPPTTAEEGAMIRYIRQEQAAGLKYYQSPCIGVPRLLFGAIMNNQTLRVSDELPHPYDEINNVKEFDTIRWRYHAPRNDFNKNALGKVIMDVSRIDMEQTPQFMSLHRPVKTICSAPWHDDWDSGLRINHYLGDWKSYSFREDSRKGGERSWEQWLFKATNNVDETGDDVILPWLGGFIKVHGLEKANELLRDAGLPVWYQNPGDENWHLLPEHVEKIVESKRSSDGKTAKFQDWVKNNVKD